MFWDSWFGKRSKQGPVKHKIQPLSDPEIVTVLKKGLSDNIGMLQRSFERCSDMIYRKISVHGHNRICLVYIEGMSDTQMLNQMLLEPLLTEGLHDETPEKGVLSAILEKRLIAAAQIRKASDSQSLEDGILNGEIAVLFEGEEEALLVNFIKMEQRGIGEPTSERVVRGPRDAFTEMLSTNTTLLRRRIHSTRLKMESLIIGELTGTRVMITYIEGSADANMVQEVRRRLQNIRTEGIDGSAKIEEQLEDNPYSPFPQVQNTERPDVAASSLLEGKVVIMMDQSPFVLIVPMSYWAGLQSAEDYHERFFYMTFVRWIRYIFVHMSLLLPSLYVALTTFHPQVVPTSLLVSILSAREGVPFPAVIEALFMELVFEGLREAGIRLPQQVGPTVSIVGALVIGQAAVEAGIVSAPMVIIVSATGIASFVFPRYNMGTAYRILKFPLLIVAGCLGFYGILLFLIALSVHMVTLQPFGIPYMNPVAPAVKPRLKDVLIRARYKGGETE
ncbi:spore germination protein [Paenibacillus enshidis]|uniref:Spore germination protein n=1 Tax=Paenibacillus enshidis TaxID=1458439 RepID=A0ABV5AZ55_9BACL